MVVHSGIKDHPGRGTFAFVDQAVSFREISAMFKV